MARTTDIRIYGEVVGSIWMPAAECTKEFEHTLVRIPRNAKTRTAHSYGWPMEISNLREALLSITNDGDFQNCAINFAVLEVTRHHGTHKRTRTWILRGKGENADCFVPTYAA